MRKVTKKLFAAFATHTNLIGKSMFTMQMFTIQISWTANPYFTPCIIIKIIIHKSLVRHIDQQKHSISFPLTPSFFSSMLSLMEIFSTAVKRWNAAIGKVSEYFRSKSSQAFVFHGWCWYHLCIEEVSCLEQCSSIHCW